MAIDLLATILGAVGSLLAGGVASSELIQKLVWRLLGKRPAPPMPYGERLAELTASLTKASRDVDSVIAELAQVARSREEAVLNLEAELAALEGREKELKQRIEDLEQTPLPVAEHFSRLLEAGEKRNARRDYLLFGAGVALTTIISILILLFTGPKPPTGDATTRSTEPASRSTASPPAAFSDPHEVDTLLLDVQQCGLPTCEARATIVSARRTAQLHPRDLPAERVAIRRGI